MTTIQERIQNAIENIGADVQYRSYSGRGMYGNTCVGITGSKKDCNKVIAAVIQEQAEDLFRTAMDCGEGEEQQAWDENDDLQSNIETLLDYHMDNMGLDVVVYWPSMEFIGQEKEEEDDTLDDE